MRLPLAVAINCNSIALTTSSLNDVFLDGNTFGFGIGSAETHRDDQGYDNPLAMEFFYQMSVSDNIAVTPAIFSVQRDNKRNDDVVGAVVKTTFSF